MAGPYRDQDVTIYDETLDLHGESDRRRTALMVVYRDGIQVVPLETGVPVTIGRTEEADIQANSRRLSRIHARFGFDGDVVTVDDLGSTNGTHVNGKRVGHAVLTTEDEVTVGSVVITLHELGALQQGLHGVERHERFLSSIEAEVERARTFGRGLAVLMIRSSGPRGMLSRWVLRIQELTRSVDRLGLFAHDTVEFLLAEADVEAARSVAMRVVQERAPEEPPLVVGIAVYPQHGSSPEELTGVAVEALAAASLATPVVSGRLDVSSPVVEDQGAPVVRNAKMVNVWKTVDRVAATNISVLIRGATGVGKEVVARALHERSDRSEGPMRCINCGAIPATLLESVLFGHERGAFTGAEGRRLGVFEEANGGTVLLDEVGELSRAAQVALLRVLETRRLTRVGGTGEEIEVDVRVLAATHRDLEEMCEKEAFRWDLYYRLNTLTISVPSLNQRVEEIRPMVRQFLDEANRLNHRQVKGVTPDVNRLLEQYDWPGNVRELRNAIERGVVIAVGDYVTVDDLPQRIRESATASLDSLADLGEREITDSIVRSPAQQQASPTSGSLRDAVTELERSLICAALCACDGNQSSAAKLLDMPRRTLVYKIRRYEIGFEYRNAEPLRPCFNDGGKRMSFKERIESFEAERIESVLVRCGGDRPHAAQRLQIQKRTLDSKIEAYGLQTAE